MADQQTQNGTTATMNGLQTRPAQLVAATVSEGSWLGRFVTLFTPVFAIFAGWIAGVVANNVPGAQLDPTQITTFMVAAVTAVLAAGLHWLHGWQQHERLVAEGHATPRVAEVTRPPIFPR